MEVEKMFQMLVGWWMLTIIHQLNFILIYFFQFTHFRYNRVIPSKTEASFMYRFFIHESYHSRSMGLSVNVHYHDIEGKMFESAAFNETIKIHEPMEGFDAETFFLYVLLLAVVALILFGGYQFFQGVR